MLLLLWSAVGGVCCWLLAETRGRDRTQWAVFGVLGGFVALGILALMRPDEEGLLAQGRMKRCGACAELIRPEALRCRYCGATQ